MPVPITISELDSLPSDKDLSYFGDANPLETEVGIKVLRGFGDLSNPYPESGFSIGNIYTDPGEHPEAEWLSQPVKIHSKGVGFPKQTAFGSDINVLGIVSLSSRQSLGARRHDPRSVKYDPGLKLSLFDLEAIHLNRKETPGDLIGLERNFPHRTTLEPGDIAFILSGVHIAIRNVGTGYSKGQYGIFRAA